MFHIAYFSGSDEEIANHIETIQDSFLPTDEFNT
jgi:ABC-type cobalt transport system substrate-binding protein